MKKKLSKIFILVLSIFSLVSCITNKPEKLTHSITYYSDGKIIEHTPSTYLEGQGMVLTPLEKTGFVFEGWYENSNFSGEKIESISADSTKDYTLYAKWSKSNDSTSSLNEALNNMDNYSYVFSYVSKDGEDSYTSSCEVYNNSLKSVYESEYGVTTEYIAFVDDMYYYYGEDIDGSFYAIPATDYYYEQYISYIDIVDLESLNPTLFTLQNGTYQLKDSSKTNEVVKALIGESENEIYNSIEITTENNVISSIVINSTYTYEGINYDYEYKILFSNHHQTQFTLPEVSNLNTTMTAEDVIKASDGESVNVKGFISGIVGNNFYLQDKTGGVYIYLGSQSCDWLTVGMEVIVQGTKDTYKGLVEVTDVTGIDETGVVEEQLEVKVLDDTRVETLNNHLCELITIPSFIVVAGSIDVNKDSSIICSDGINQFTLFVSKHLSNSVKEEIKLYFDSATIDQSFTLNNAIVSCFNNPQIVITESSTISLDDQEVTEIGLTSNLDTIKVLVNTSMFDALKQLVVYVERSNGTKYALNMGYWTIFYSDYDPTKEGVYPILISYNNFELSINIEVTAKSDETTKVSEDTKKLDDVIKDLGITRGMPSIGNPRILVIPVAFTDYPAPSNMETVLQKAFFGTSEDTGWESLQSYYYKSSYGKLTIEGSVLPVFNTGKKSTYYDEAILDMQILEEALKYYDSQINYAEYDTDKDGYIDGIYLVYTAEINYYDSDSVWWAFTTEYITDQNVYYDGVEADYYLFAGYDFLFEDLVSGSSVTYNMETFIHETGHMFGLDDYYDYDSSKGPLGGLGGGDMMDANVGDHNAFSKAILGWTNPWLVEGNNATITLESFGKTGDCLIIGNNFNGTYFDEYFIVDFYTPDGLNELEKGNAGLFSTVGIRIYHIDARLSKSTNISDVWSIYASNNGSTSHKLIELVEADRANDIAKDGLSENDDLFQSGVSFTWGTWYNGTNAGFTLTVVSVDETFATITITY